MIARGPSSSAPAAAAGGTAKTSAATSAGATAASSSSSSSPGKTAAAPAASEQMPPVLQAVATGLCKAVMAGRSPPSYMRFTEEWYWAQLLDKPFRTVYASEVGGGTTTTTTTGGGSTARCQCLIDPPHINLSQTPREQCELEQRVTEGLDLPGPGQEVELHGLTAAGAAAELNGRRGRVLPARGRGAPAAAPSAGRVAVRLPGGREVAVRPENLRSPHAAASSSPSAAAASGPGSGLAPAPAPTGAAAKQAQQQQQPQRPPPNAALAALIRADVQRGAMPPLMTRETVLRCGVAADKVRCVRCGRTDATEFMALKRVAPLSPRPCPEAVRLECLDCSAREAEAQGVAATAGAVEDWVDERVMGSMEACGILMGHPRTMWGHQNLGSGAMY